MRGDTLFTIGACTLVGSVGAYVVACIVGMGRMLLDLAVTPDAMALALIGVLLGLVIMALGYALGEYQRGKGTPHGSDRPR